MAARTVAVWGRNGCGATTTAVNLALYISKKQKMVALISARDYDELSAYFNIVTPTDKGIKAAKEHSTEHIRNYYVETGNNSNVYLLGPATGSDSLENSGLDKAAGRRIFQESKDVFDYVIIDCSSHKENAITGEAVALADKVIVPVNPNITYGQWFQSNKRIFDNIRNKTLFVESMSNGECSMQTVFSLLGRDIRSTTALQYIPEAPLFFNQGKPLFLGLGRISKIYESGLAKLWEEIG